MKTKIILFFAALLGSVSLYAQEQRSFFDWSKVMVLPPKRVQQVEGDQILHFNTSNKPYQQNPEATQFVSTYLSKAKQVPSDAGTLQYALEQVKVDGPYIELNVQACKPINFTAALNPQRKIYGFDSLNGLPEEWKRLDKSIPAGTFGYKPGASLPPLLSNVVIIQGEYEKTIPEFIKSHLKGGQVAFLHFNCDIYSLAAKGFQLLGDYIGEGTILLFDELYNYPGSEQHEFKALQEFLTRSGWSAEYIAFNPMHEQVAVLITKKKD